MVRGFTDLLTAQVSGLKTAVTDAVIRSSMRQQRAAVGGGHMEEAFVKHFERWLA